MSAFTIGCDPEVFVKNTKTGKIVSGHGLIEGSKKAPHAVKGGAYQVDGMALELNITPVPLTARGWGAQNGTAFSRQVLSVQRQMEGALKAVNPDLSLAIQSTADFDPAYLETQPDEAKELGCDPDFCAYTGLPNERPDGAVNFRTAAGHIHIGWGADIPVDHPDHLAICCDLVKVLDMWLGLPMLVIDRDARRRELYGKAGAFRPKPYGVEYRTPSNAWLRNDGLRQAVYDHVAAACTDLQKYEGDVDRVIAARRANAGDGWSSDAIRKIIDEDRVEVAKRWTADWGYGAFVKEAMK